MIYSINDIGSFVAASKLLQEIDASLKNTHVNRNETERNPDIALIGNKSDLEHLRHVQHKDGKKLADKYGAGFWETSASESYDSLSRPLTSLIVNSFLESNKEAKREDDPTTEVKNHQEKKRTIQRKGKGKRSNMMAGKNRSLSLTDLNTLDIEASDLVVSKITRTNSVHRTSSNDSTTTAAAEVKKETKREKKNSSLRRSKSLRGTSLAAHSSDEKQLEEQIKSVSTFSMPDMGQRGDNESSKRGWRSLRKGGGRSVSSEHIDDDDHIETDEKLEAFSGRRSMKSRISDMFRV